MSSDKVSSFLTRVVSETPTHIVVEVPSPFPDGHRMVTACILKESQHVESISITMTAEHFGRFAEYQHRYGLLEREPTAVELDSMMRTLGHVCVETSAELMTTFARLCSHRLGVRDEGEVEAARLASLCAALTAHLSKNGVDVRKLTPEQQARIREYAEEVMSNESIISADSYGEVNKRHDEVMDDLLQEFNPIDDETKVVRLIAYSLSGRSCVVESSAKVAEIIGIAQEHIPSLCNTVKAVIERYNGKEMVNVVDSLQTVFGLLKPGYRLPMERIVQAMNDEVDESSPGTE